MFIILTHEGKPTRFNVAKIVYYRPYGPENKHTVIKTTDSDSLKIVVETVDQIDFLLEGDITIVRIK